MRWYVARDDAPLLGFPSALNNLVFARDRDDWVETAVGEIFGSQYTQQPPDVNPLALGDHYCGTPEDFAGEGAIDMDSPPVEYRPDGLPLCCGQQYEPAGGLGIGGDSTSPTFELVLVQVVSSSGDPPVHVCTELTRDTANNVVETSPPVTYSQVLNPDACAWPDGARVLLYPIKDWPGWYWGEPVLQFESTDTLQLSQDPDTDVVTGNVITNLSVEATSDGVQLVGDSVPAEAEYYGTAPTTTALGYQSFPAAVGAAASVPAVINLWLAQLLAGAPAFGLVIVPIGGGLFAIGVDLHTDHQTDETLVNTASLAVTDSAVLQVTRGFTIYTNSFNIAGMIIDRQAGVPDSNTTSVNVDGSETIEVTGSSATHSLTFAAIYQDSITADASGLRLVGDQADPGPGFAYSTDASGNKGWYPFDSIWIENVAGVVSHIGPSSTGHTTVAFPSSVVYDGKGHIVSTVAGTSVTSISTTNASGGPITGSVTFNGGTGITLGVASNTITITATGGGIVGPAPASAPTLTATPGNTQVSLSWTTVSGATTYQLTRGGTQIFLGSGTSFVDTGLTNGTLYNYAVSGVNNNAAGPAGTASATPVAPVVTGTSSSSGTTGSMGVTLPTNANGDELCMFIWNDSGNSLASVTPAGWTLRATQFSGTTNTCGNLFVRTSTGGLGTVTISTIAQGHWRAIVGNYGAVAWESSTGQASGGSSTSIVCPSVTPTAGAHGLTSFYFADNAATGTSSVAAGQASTINGGIAIGTETVTGTGATGTRTGGISPAAWSGGISTLTH